MRLLSTSRSLFAALLLGGLATTLSAARAQDAAAPKVEFPAPSPHATLKQRVGVTDIEIDYSRPSARGRKIFGDLVPYGQVWRTGANASTKITFSDEVKFGDKPVPAGKYALYTIPGADEWTVILSKDTSLWGAYKYKPENDLLRFTVKPVALPDKIESFMIDFDELREDSALLCLVWENLYVPVKISTDAVAKTVASIERAAADTTKPQPPGFYAQAAIFYLSHNLDLKKALDWIDKAIAGNPKSYRALGYKAQIQAKLGDKAGAIATAQKAIELNKASEEPDLEEVQNQEKFIAGLKNS